MKNFINSLFCSQKRDSWRRLAVLALSTGLLAAGLLAGFAAAASESGLAYEDMIGRIVEASRGALSVTV